MNSVKKVVALASPEIAARRSSIGVKTGLQVDSQFLKGIHTNIGGDSKCHNDIPSIIVTSHSPRSDTATGDSNCGTLFDAGGINPHHDLGRRRASCVPSFQAWGSTPDERAPRNVFEHQVIPWLSDSVRRLSQTVSPWKQIGRRRKTMSENSDDVEFSGSFTMSPVFTSPNTQQLARETRSQSIIKLPTLSPCQEIKSKDDAFLFDEDAVKYQNIPSVRRRKSNIPLKNRISLQTSNESHLHSKSNERKLEYRRNSIAISKLATLRQLNRKGTKTPASGESIYMRTLTKPWRHGAFIGKGGYGCVRVGLCKGKKVAIKQLKRISSLENEMSALNFDVHPRLVTTYAIVTCRNSIISSTKSRRPSMTNTLLAFDSGYFQKAGFSPCNDQKKTFVLSELCSSSTLATLINSFDKELSDMDKIRLLGQLTEALDYLHSCGYAHLDVKPSNCFLTGSGNLKLGDFGCCTPIGNTPNMVLGTASYQCPEILKGGSVTNTSDIYSWGITAWTLLTTKVPYEGLHPHIIIYKVTRLHHRPECSFSGQTLAQSLLTKIMQSCWDQDATRRPTAAVIRKVLSALYLQC